MIHVRRLPSAEALIQHTADSLEGAVTRAAGPPFTLLLAGGSTPYPAYNRVARRRPAAANLLHLSLTDERYVDADSAASNYHNMKPLIEALGLPPERVLRVETEQPRAEAVTRFASLLRAFLDRGGHVPLAFLGLGADGHTCALFSDRDLARAQGRLAIDVDRPDGRAGVTVTPLLLSHAEKVVFLVAGEGKREVLDRFVNDTEHVIAGKAVRGHPAVEVWTEPHAWPLPA